MADYAALGNFLPYLLGRRLRAVVWPEKSGERIAPVLLLTLMALYGAGFGLLLRYRDAEGLDERLPHILVGMNAVWLVSILLADFLPSLRPVTRPLPEHFPVSERANVLTAFLLDLLTLRRLLLATLLLTALLVAPGAAAVPGFSLLLVLGASAWSFNVRLLVTLGRWRHPLLLAHVASLGLMVGWLLRLETPYSAALGLGMALLPWVLFGVQLWWLGPRFSTRYLPAAAVAASSSATLTRLPLPWRIYVRRVWQPLALGLAFKVLLLVLTGLFLVKDGKVTSQGFFYFALLPVISFTYVNNNLFAFLGSITANELQRLGLTPRLVGLYVQLAGPTVLAECLVAAILLVLLFPPGFWPLLGLLPLGALALLSLGLWGSLYLAKPVIKPVDFANMRNNASQAMSLATIGTAALLYFLPWWWVRVPLALLVTLSAIYPLRQVWRNDGELRRRLWQGIGA